MSDVVDQDLTGSRFERVDLSGSTFRNVRFRDDGMRMVDLTGLVIRDAELKDVDITGEIDNLKINGVEVGPLVEAELDRRDPERAKMRATDADGIRAAWAVVERRWELTVQRARGLPDELLHANVDEEWSFVKTLRHVVFATDAWVRRAILGEAEPWHALDLPHDDMPDTPGVPRDRGARPSLDEVLALRAVATVRKVLEAMTDERLAGTTDPVLDVGYPESRSFPVRQCLKIILNEEWQHRTYAERDLAVLESRAARPARD